jgi:hypothetical protein
MRLLGMQIVKDGISLHHPIQFPYSFFGIAEHSGRFSSILGYLNLETVVESPPGQEAAQVLSTCKYHANLPTDPVAFHL